MMNTQIAAWRMGVMLNSIFKVMSLIFALRDRITAPWSVLDAFGIEKGQTVIDYGCGTGSYLKRASELVGAEGVVFAVDIHELAIEAVSRRIEKDKLSNVTALLAVANNTSLPDEIADVIYALDVFHMVQRPEAFLKELNRICKRKGELYIDNGHQTRARAIAKMKSSGVWEIAEETSRYIKCNPIKGKQDTPIKTYCKGELV